MSDLEKKMTLAASNLEFEKAAEYRDEIAGLRKRLDNEAERTTQET